ncbi:hypothetical protein K1719_031273 [Acacia pycnantha]|nr:hypothetical protein K1719_031273 [Acacia pycnantha]
MLQGQMPLNPMVTQNPMVPMPMPMQMQIQMPMPYQMQMPMPLHMPFPLPLSSQEIGQSAYGKRRREDEAPGIKSGGSSAKKVFVYEKIREDSRATIKIADAIARHEERVIIISSKDNDENITDPRMLLTNSQFDFNGHVAANTIRLLIAGSRAGGLIGVSGQNIEKLRNSSRCFNYGSCTKSLSGDASKNESFRGDRLSTKSMLMASDFKGLFGQYQGASNHEELHNFIKATMMIQRLKRMFFLNFL